MRDYLSKMLYALTSAYSRKDYDNRQQLLPMETNIGKLFSIFAWGLDSVEEQAELVRLWDDLDNARGAVLDRYGANFGVARISPDDRFYRLAIKVKVMSQLSGGDIDTVIQAASALLDVEPTDVLLEEVYPAKIALYVDQELLSSERLDLIEQIAYSVKRILAAGVGMRLYTRTYHTFRCELTFLRAGYMDTVFATLPVSKDRSARQPVSVARGAVQRPGVYTSPPEVQRALTGRQSGTGGAIYHAHIISRRID